MLKKQNSKFLLSVEKCALCNWQLKSLNLSIALVWRCSSYALSYQNITVFLGKYKLKIFLWKFVGHSVWYFCLRMCLVVGWCYSNCRASLQVLNPNVTPITFYNNVIRIENTASTLSAALWLILTFREIKSFLGHFRGNSRLVNYIFLQALSFKRAFRLICAVTLAWVLLGSSLGSIFLLCDEMTALMFGMLV